MNSITLNGLTLTAITSFYYVVSCKIVITKDGKEIGSISSVEIDTKIKPENREAVKQLVADAIAGHVITADEQIDIDRIAKNEKNDADYAAHTKMMKKAMNP